MALLAMEEAAANNGLTVAGGGEACVASVHLALCIFWVKIKQHGERWKEMEDSTKSFEPHS